MVPNLLLFVGLFVLPFTTPDRDWRYFGEFEVVFDRTTHYTDEGCYIRQIQVYCDAEVEIGYDCYAHAPGKGWRLVDAWVGRHSGMWRSAIQLVTQRMSPCTWRLEVADYEYKLDYGKPYYINIVWEKWD